MCVMPLSHIYFFFLFLANSLCSFLNKKCHNNGFCDGNYNRVKCVCNSGFYGDDCGKVSHPVMFQKHSFIHLSLGKSVNLPNIDRANNKQQQEEYQDGNLYQHGVEYYNGFITKVEFTFRTRQSHGEIIRLIGLKPQTYCIIEIRNSRITFRFNLNGNGKKLEKSLTIDSFAVNDGQWHQVEAYRFGQSAFLTIDNGGIGKSNRLLTGNNHAGDDVDDGESELNNKHFLFEMNKQRIIIGGEVHYMNIGTTTIANDFADGIVCQLFSFSPIFTSKPNLHSSRSPPLLIPNSYEKFHLECELSMNQVVPVLFLHFLSSSQGYYYYIQTTVTQSQNNDRLKVKFFVKSQTKFNYTNVDRIGKTMKTLNMSLPS